MFRGGWKAKRKDKPNHGGNREGSPEWLESGEDLQVVSAQPEQRFVGFRSLPTKTLGVLPLKGKAFKEKAKPRSQFADLREMMGTGPVLEGVKPSEIQRSEHFLISQH